MIQRGVVYDVLDRDGAAALALTNDRWNARMAGVGVLELSDSQLSPYAVQVRTDSGQASADVSRILVAPQEQVGAARCVVDDSELRRAERALAALLQLDRLLSDPPTAMRPPAGAVDYPRWAEIYYLAARPVADDKKRYVVVSADSWNSMQETVLVARLTSQPKASSDEFPPVDDGRSRVCCGELAAIRSSAVDLRARPAAGARRLGLGDMTAVARGFVHTHEIRGYG